MPGPTSGGWPASTTCWRALVFGGALRAAQRAALAAGLPPGPAPHLLVLGGGAGWVLTAKSGGSGPWRGCGAVPGSLGGDAGPHPRPAPALPPPRRGPGAAPGHEAALRPSEQFDAILTFFVLDCFTEAALPRALARLQAARRPGAPWLVADFRPARQGWRRWLLAHHVSVLWAHGGAARAPHPLAGRAGAPGLAAHLETVFFKEGHRSYVLREADQVSSIGLAVELKLGAIAGLALTLQCPQSA
ncbi:MAG: hypothetical protein WKG07_42895 [Hymenobacter sp.]